MTLKTTLCLRNPHLSRLTLDTISITTTKHFFLIPTQLPHQAYTGCNNLAYQS
jgi:hypothetical protein